MFRVFLGAILRPYNFSPETILLISYPGELFMRILKLLTLPLLISSLINVSANLNLQMNGKIALRTIVYFAITSMLSTFLGICLALLFQSDKLSTIRTISKLETTKSTILDSILDLGRWAFCE